MNLFLTEDGVLKLGYYGLTTQSECYSIKKKECDGVRSFAPEVFRGAYEMKSDVWSFGIALIEMLGIIPYYWCDNDHLPTMNGGFELPFDHPSCPILYKILVSVLNRPFLHKQNSKSCHYFLLVCDSKSENLSGHFFVSS